MKTNDIDKLPSFIKRLIFLVIVICALFSHASAERVVNQSLDWNEVLVAFEKYFDCPSSENAQAILRIVPMSIPGKESGDKGKALEYVINSIEFRILASEAVAGEKSAAEIIFRLRKFSDGWDSEVLDGTLGELLRIDPLLFLELLFEYKNDFSSDQLKYPVAFPNYAYNNHESAFVYVLGKRIEALSRVDDRKYDELKQECIKQIRREMNPSLVTLDRPVEYPQESEKSGSDLDWGKVLLKFEKYFNYPSPENAISVLSLIPKERPDNVFGDKRQALAYINSAETYGILDLESEAGDKHSIEILIRLLGITETSESKLFKSTLASIVRLNPRLFLNVLYEYKDVAVIKEGVFSVAYLSDAYVERPCASKHELEKRIMALDGITESRYAEIKEACLSELKKAIEKIKN